MLLIKFRNVVNFSVLLAVLGALFMNLSVPQDVCGVSWIELDGQETEMTFKSMGAGSGKTEDGSEFSFAWMKSADGVVVSTRTERRKSAARAGAVLKKTLRGAEIIERSPKVNNRGRQIGQRVTARLSQEPNKIRYVMVWTEGPDFHYLESVSLPHLLAFEKRYYP